MIREYLNAVNEQKLPGNAEILKEAKKILEQLPLMESKDLEEHLKSVRTFFDCSHIIILYHRKTKMSIVLYSFLIWSSCADLYSM